MGDIVLTKAFYEILNRQPYKTETVVVGRKKLKVEVADSFMKKMIGLMYRENMGKTDGMLFKISEPGVMASTITTINMRFSIDIVWLDSRKRVVDVARNAEPSPSIFASYRPRKPAAYVMELRAGAAKKLGIEPGDKVAFP